MKYALCAAALLAFAAAPALAQTPPAAPPASAAAVAPLPPSACPALPGQPTLPADGAAAKQGEMMKGQEAFNAWLNAAKPAVECRQNEVRMLNQDLLAQQAKVKARAEQYNPDVAAYNGVVDQWRGVVEAYQAKTATKKK